MRVGGEHNEFTQAPINNKFLEPEALKGPGVVAITNIMDGPREPRIRYVLDGPRPQVLRDRLIEVGMISPHRPPSDDDGISFYRGALWWTGGPLRSFEVVRPVLRPLKLRPDNDLRAPNVQFFDPLL